MNVIYVDDEALAVKKFELVAERIDDVKQLMTFQNSKEALEYVRGHTVDVAFLDIEMPGMRGIPLAREMKAVDENIKIIFVTAYNQYALDAFEVEAIGYLMKPYTREKVENELEKAKRIKKVAAHKVFMQTIPSFNILVDGEVLLISRPKVKELLALMVDKKGSPITISQAIAYLWEERPDDDATKALYRMTAKRLRDLLTEHKIDNILDSANNQRAVRTDEFDCDYYEILNDNEKYIKNYHGEYMTEYSWAEETNANLSDMLDVF